MAKVQAIIEDALVSLGVVDYDEPMQGPDADRGLRYYNRMCHGWKLKGADKTFTDQALQDDFFLGPEYEEGTVALLSVRLAPVYEVDLRPEIVAFANRFWAELKAEVLASKWGTDDDPLEPDLDLALQDLPSEHWEATYYRSGGQ